MCGRYVLTASPEEVQALFGHLDEVWFPARYNIAPTQPIAVVRLAGGQRHCSMMRWGLVPAWVEEPSSFKLLLNARAENIRDKPAFRDAIRYRRCLVPASGFYEWRRGPGKARQPFWLRPRAGGLVAFAGLYDTWTGAGSESIDSACIITVPANRETAAIHDRMPAVIRPADFDLWLSESELPSTTLNDLLRSPPDGTFEVIPVSTRVNAAANDGPDLIEPQALGADAGGLFAATARRTGSA